MTTTRTLRSYGPTDIKLGGITKGPTSGWSWNATTATLSHPMGLRMVFNPDAAERITTTVNSYQEPPAAIRAPAWGDDEHDNVAYWRAQVAAQNAPPLPPATLCEFDTSEVIRIERG